MRINKYMSLTGLFSRRETDRLIEANRITINGKECQRGGIVSDGDVVCVDGTPVEITPLKQIYIALNKPRGITCTAQKKVEGNIIDFVNYPERIFPVGRLDKASEGLILLTNDGDIVNRLLRTENNHEKEYIVTVDKEITDSFIEGMAQGVPILGVTTKECKVTKLDHNVFSIILTQGLNRQIRRMTRFFGFTVEKLERIRILNINLSGLPSGQWRYLTNQEVKELHALL